MTTFEAFLAAKGIYLLTLILLALGVAGIIVCNNYMKKLICMNVMQVAVIFFFLCLGQKSTGTIPVAVGEGRRQRRRTRFAGSVPGTKSAVRYWP